LAWKESLILKVSIAFSISLE